jgi:hypothetical protein
MDAYNHTVWGITSTNTTGTSIVWDYIRPYWGELGPKGFKSVPFMFKGIKLEGPPQTIHGWQFLGEGEEKARTPNEMVWLSQETWDPWSSPEPRKGSRYLRSNFQLNASLSTDLRMMAYNSTLWLRGAPTHLQAPFLDLGKDWYANTQSGYGFTDLFFAAPMHSFHPFSANVYVTMASP